MKFYAFDTETINRPGHGEACLLIRSIRDGEKSTFSANDKVQWFTFPSSFKDIFDFMRGGSYVAWNMDFDMRSICHTYFLPLKTVEDIAIFGRVEWGGFVFRYIAGKSFEVHRDKEAFKIFDLAQFYGSSLKTASEKFLPTNNQKGEIPGTWYNEIDECLRDKRRQSIINYAIQDVNSTQSLADRLINQIHALGIRPRRLSSCAGLARIKYGKVMGQVRPPDYLNRVYRGGFFGGRIECGRLGKIGPSKLYDIHSAYPSVIANLVDPRGETLESGKDWKYRGATYGAYKIRVSCDRNMYWGPLAVRHRGKVIYPVGEFQTDCGASAIDSLRRNNIKFDVLKSHEIFANSKKPIFEDIEVMYEKRKDPSCGMAIKTILNSTYGVLAEATNYNIHEELENPGNRIIAGRIIRSFTSFGRYTNFILASHITEAIRMRLWEIMNEHKDGIYFAATDGLLLRSNSSINCVDKLGGWGLKDRYDTATILGCGRYFLRNRKAVEFHLRGFPVKEETFERLRNTKRGYAEIPCLQTDSLKQWAASFGDELNVLQEVKRRFEINDDKRHWEGSFKSISEAWEKQITSKPYIIG